MEELFGINKIPTIGARHVGRIRKSRNFDSYPETIIIGDKYIQEIISNNEPC